MIRRRNHAACDCDECAGLDLAFPGEGRQLALPVPTPKRRTWSTARILARQAGASTGKDTR